MLKLISIFVMLASTLSPQSQYCQNELNEEEKETALQYQEAGLYNLDQVLGAEPIMVDVKIKWHIVSTTWGQRAIEKSTLHYYMEDLNAAFFPMGIRFVEDPVIHYIVDDDLFVDVTDTWGLRFMSPLDGAINIYWAPSFIGGNLCGASSFTMMPYQGIVMQTTCLGYEDVSGILIHEVGHYFDLFHTHTFECPAGNDCETQGDFVCDTPPSNNLFFHSCVDVETCGLWETYLSNGVPFRCISAPHPKVCPEEIPYDPGICLINYMSYVPPPCLQAFTLGQRDRAKATYWNLRPELQNVPIPECVGDLTGDGHINGEDLSSLLGEWGEAGGDLDGDGFTDGADLAIILNKWGEC